MPHPLEQPGAIMVRAEPVMSCGITVWHLVTAWEKYNATHSSVIKVSELKIPYFGRLGTGFHVGKIDEEDPVKRLEIARAALHQERQRVKHVIDKVLSENDIPFGDHWEWIPESAYYRVMQTTRPFGKDLYGKKPKG